jgi:hypothetical protein
MRSPDDPDDAEAIETGGDETTALTTAMATAAKKLTRPGRFDMPFLLPGCAVSEDS